MMAKTKGFHPTALETKAIDVAWQRWQEFEKLNRLCPGSFRDPERHLFTQLGKTARQLRAALGPFISAPMTSEISRLLMHMQETEHCTLPQDHYRTMLDELFDSLELLSLAATAEVNGAGRQTDLFARRWILTAADAWMDVCKTDPSASAGGRFFQTLSSFKNSHKPAITERNLRTVLAERQKSPTGHREAQKTPLAAVPFSEDVVAYAIDCTLAAISQHLDPQIKMIAAAQANAQTKGIFGGERLYIAKGSNSRAERNAAIKRDHDVGDKIPILVSRYGLGKSQLWKIISG